MLHKRNVLQYVLGGKFSVFRKRDEREHECDIMYYTFILILFSSSVVIAINLNPENLILSYCVSSII